MPVVRGSVISSVPARAPAAGGQSFESGNILFAAGDPATKTVPSTVQLAPSRAPLSQRPPRQRGQTLSRSVR